MYMLLIVRREGLYLKKIPVTSLGIEPATFQLVPQCLGYLERQLAVCPNLS